MTSRTSKRSSGAHARKTARKTAPGRPFTGKDDPRNGHGKKGRSGRKPAAYKEALKSLEPLALQVVERALRMGLRHSDFLDEGLRAAKDVMDRLHGKATQPVTGEDGGPVDVRITYEYPDAARPAQ